MFSINQGTNEDESQSDPHPDAGLFAFGQQAHEMVNRATEQERNGHDITISTMALMDDSTINDGQRSRVLSNYVGVWLWRKTKKTSVKKSRRHEKTFLVQK